MKELRERIAREINRALQDQDYEASRPGHRYDVFAVADRVIAVCDREMSGDPKSWGE